MGQENRGVIVSLTLTERGVTLNEPVFADFSIENALDESVRFDLGHNRKSNFSFTITDPDGAKSPDLRLSTEGLGRLGKLSLEPQQSYRQRLLLNEWHDFAKPGEYKIEGSLASPIESESGKPVGPTQLEPLRLEILERNADRLRQVSGSLARPAIESSDVQESADAALALSHITDPIAVPYLEKALKEGRAVWQYVIPGLARIANKEAIEILIATLKGPDREAAALAEFSLKRLKSEIADAELKAKIEAALA